MPEVLFRFYAELNDLLPVERRQVAFAQPFKGRVSVKHLVESLGVPHSEIDLILANGQPVDFDYLVQDKDLISVYPVFETLDIGTSSRLRPEPLRNVRFVLDTHLGQLATYLRLLGFDTLYRNDYDDPELAEIARQERRILLTKDRGLLKRKSVTHGYCVRAIDPEEQMLEVVRRFDLLQRLKPFQRCLRCNGLTDDVSKASIAYRLPEDTRRFYNEFRLCRDCQQIYWKGSHYRRMRAFLKRTLNLDFI